ncbi:MAG: penicillin-binding protein activator [Pseudomonadota bacterium]
MTLALLVPLGAAQERVAADAQAIVNGARMALSDAAVRRLTMSVHDTGGTAAGARVAAERAVAGGADVILGPLFAQSASAVAPIAEREGIAVLSFSTDTNVAGPPVWVTGFTPEAQVDRIFGYASRQGIRRVAVYAPDVPYGAAALRAVDGAAARHGIVIVAESRYPRSFQDIQRTARLFVEDATAGGAEAILLPDFGQGLTTASSFIDFLGMPQPGTRYLGLGQWEAGTTLREPTLQGGWFAGADAAALDAFASDYVARYEQRPPFTAVLGFDAASIAAELVRDSQGAGGGDPFSLTALTRETGFRGAVGAVRLNPDGTTTRGLAVLEVGNREFTLLEGAPARLGAGF